MDMTDCLLIIIALCGAVVRNDIRHKVRACIMYRAYLEDIRTCITCNITFQTRAWVSSLYRSSFVIGNIFKFYVKEKTNFDSWHRWNRHLKSKEVSCVVIIQNYHLKTKSWTIKRIWLYGIELWGSPSKSNKGSNQN